MEMLIKVLALTPRGYLKNNWNVFDGTLVIISTIDIVLSISNVVDGNELAVLKVFRLVSALFNSFMPEAVVVKKPVH